MERMRQIRFWVIENKNKMYMAAVVITIAAAILIFCGYGKNDEVAWDNDGGKTGTGIVSEDSSQDSESANTKTSSQNTTESIYVDIEGEVLHPGVYTATSKTRVFEIVEKAGGFTEQADPALINQAEVVTDGEKITVPAKGSEGGTGDTGDAGKLASAESSGGNQSSGLININTAGLELLQQIPGVGPATAQKIVDYRNQNGRFKKTEDLMKVSGIGEKTFEKMREGITV